jgi:hypothetical protein
MQQEGRAADHSGEAQHSEPREEDAVMVKRRSVHAWEAESFETR